MCVCARLLLTGAGECCAECEATPTCEAGVLDVAGQCYLKAGRPGQPSGSTARDDRWADRDDQLRELHELYAPGTGRSQPVVWATRLPARAEPSDAGAAEYLGELD